MTQRLKLGYKMRRFENGKEIEKRYVTKFNDAFPLMNVKGIK